MIIEGTILDEVSGAPVKGAKISAYNGNGVCTDIGETDVSGRYLVEMANTAAGFLVKHSDYTPVLVDLGTMQNTPNLGLVKNLVAGEPQKSVTNTVEKIPMWVWVAAGAGLLTMTGKKKVSGEVDYSKFIIPAGLVVGGYLVLTKLGLIGPSGPGTGSNNAKNAESQAATQSDLQKAAAAGVVPTISDSAAASIANDIFANATSDTGLISSSSRDAIVSDLTNNVRTVADYLAIKLAFGVRASARSAFSWCGFFGVNCPTYDLDTTIKNAMDADHLEDIRNFLASKGYNF